MPINIVDYGTPQQPNLNAISKAVFSRLNGYNNLLSRYHISIVTKDIHLVRTPRKPNTARMISRVYCDSRKVGDLYVILFAPEDGTGNESYCTLEKVSRRMDGTKFKAIGPISQTGLAYIDIPSEYQYAVKAERVLPRNKLREGVLLEAFFPLLTVEGHFGYPGKVSLEELTILKDGSYQIGKELDLGLSPEEYNVALQAATIPSPQIQLTCGYRCNGQRFGDPHATYFNPKLADGHPHRMQVAGFLAVKSADNPLCKVLDEIAMVPQRVK